MQMQRDYVSYTKDNSRKVNGRRAVLLRSRTADSVLTVPDISRLISILDRTNALSHVKPAFTVTASRLKHHLRIRAN